MLYAISVVAERTRANGDQVISHIAFVVEAANLDEAIGKGHRAGVKVYPWAEGWKNHGVSTSPASQVITDPEKIKVEAFDRE